MSTTQSTITGFHAHIYFEQSSTEAARTLCEQAAERFGVAMGQLHTRPVGPHPMPSCQLDCSPQKFGELLPWLLENRGDLIVFCHAQSGDHLTDHTRNIFWLGEVQSLNLEMFR
ncbi:DOPA 4,5-dioxygenase family protein [Epibacterium ulvae]|uniref:DOPA 4,5-dioxygenase family protein n=1 Tax=Epibacterium ulvae TaxID=1156985 RepID=UPI0024938AB2|nr:DOPA 4,5-dioxygenase family protein [Epibacterium ulvae]